jgi:glycosyltransferase involved in cell wall biosynthesis/thioesterase domain-containing protein
MSTINRVNIIQKGDGTAPLFFAHSPGGSAYYAATFAKYLGKGQTLYALQWQEAEAGITLTLESLARYYVEAIQATEPSGPYYLIGHSFGGQLALEIAQQLMAAGKAVAFLGVINDQANLLARRFGTSHTSPASASTYDRCRHLLQTYVPKPYSGFIDLFLAEVSMPESLADPLLGWGYLAPGRVAHFEVPGEHTSMMGETAVAQWAGLLLERITVAKARYTPDTCAALPPAVEVIRQAQAAGMAGNLTDEIRYYQQAIALDTEQPYWVYRHLAEALLQQGQADAALQAFQQALTREQMPLTGTIRLFQVFKEQGRAAEAEQCIRNIQAFEHDLEVVHFLQGQLLQEQKLPALAEPHLRRAMELQPGRIGSYHKLCWALEHLGRVEDALAIAKRAVILPHSLGYSHCLVGRFLMKLGDLPNAELHVRKALELAPNLALAQTQLKQMLHLKGPIKEQIDVDARVKEAGNHLSNGQYLEALNMAKAILATEKPPAIAYRIAEQAAIELGEFELAKNIYLSLPSAPLPAKPRTRGKNPVLPPQFKLPPIIGGGNDYRHILERTELFKASNQAYTKTVSIIIPVYDRQAVLANTLAALTHQTYPLDLIEIIVVDDGSHDGILDVIRKYESRLNLYYARQNDQGYRLAAARNLGLKLAKGEAIIFMDADILPLPHTVESYMQVLHVSNECVLIGHRRYVDVAGINDDDILADIDVAASLPDINPDNDVADEKAASGMSIDWRFPVYAKTDYLINDLWPFTKAAGGNLAFSRQLIRQGGYVDEAFNAWGCEDIEHGYRLYNAGAYFIPMMDILCLHQEPLDAKSAVPADTESKSFRAAGHEITRPILARKCPAPTVRAYQSGLTFDIPKVSIYIPAYNASRYIVESVQSCLKQTFNDLEVFICDDGSTDNTLPLLEEHFSGNPRVRWVSQKNGGIGKATNTAIRHCRGMYIAQLDADDLLKPDAVQACVRLLDGKGVEAVYADCDYIDENGKYIRDGWCGGEFSREWMATGMIATDFRMFRKRIWSRIAGCNEEIKNAVDFDLWLKIDEKGSIGHIHQILYSYRWHGENTSLMHRKQQENNHLKVVADSFVRRGLERFWTIQTSNNPLNPREFAIVPAANPAPVTPKDVVFLIPTCERYFGKKKAIQETWARELDAFGFRYLFLAGKPDLSSPVIEEDTLYVPCQDDYEHLLLKLVLGYQFLYRNMDFSHVYKLDDDCFPNLGRIATHILPQLAGKQYAGGSIHPKATVMNNTWHYGKCSNPQFEKPYPANTQPFAFAKGGYGYFLRRDSLPALFEQLDVLKEELEHFKYSFEDLRVAEILNHSGITVHALEHYVLARNVMRLPDSCTVVYDISEPESFFQISKGI